MKLLKQRKFYLYSDPTPSAEVKRVTQCLFEAGQILGIEVLDHIVIGEKGRLCSLKEHGML